MFKLFYQNFMSLPFKIQIGKNQTVQILIQEICSNSNELKFKKRYLNFYKKNK